MHLVIGKGEDEKAGKYWMQSFLSEVISCHPLPYSCSNQGCFRVSLPEEYPELEKVRGSVEEQKKADWDHIWILVYRSGECGVQVATTVLWYSFYLYLMIPTQDILDSDVLESSAWRVFVYCSKTTWWFSSNLPSQIGSFRVFILCGTRFTVHTPQLAGLDREEKGSISPTSKGAETESFLNCNFTEQHWKIQTFTIPRFFSTNHWGIIEPL